MKKLIRTIVFVVSGILILQMTESILAKKWNYLGDDEDFSRTYDQFYKLDEDVLQAVFLGKSSVKWSVSPILLYKENNYVTYNLASNYQSVALSYHLLYEVFKRQSPEVVFCDVSALFENVNMDYTWHMALDNMPMSKNKINAAFTYAQILNEEEHNDEESYRSFEVDFLSMMSPLYSYHSRWDSLNQNDFIKPKNPHYDFLAGYYMTAVVSGTGLTYEKVNAEVDTLKMKEGFKKEYLNGKYMEHEVEEELYEVKWDQTAIEYVKKMKKLCEDQGAALVMVKIPTMYMPQEWYGSWSYDKYIMVKKLCDEMGIPFLDMVYDKGYPAEIDWQQDTLDHGMHLNIRGAEKVTKRFGKYMEDMGLEKKICEFYWNCFRDYEYMSQICALQSECNLNEYLSGALEGGNYTIVISAQNDFQTALSEENVQILSKTGFRSNFTEGIRDSFIGIIRQGEVKYEALSNRKIEYEDFLPGGGAKWKLSVLVIIPGLTHP